MFFLHVPFQWGLNYNDFTTKQSNQHGATTNGFICCHKDTIANGSIWRHFDITANALPALLSLMCLCLLLYWPTSLLTLLPLYDTIVTIA